MKERKRMERDWHRCHGCGELVVTRKLHGRPLRKWHAWCWANRPGVAKEVRANNYVKQKLRSGDLPAAEIERRIAEHEALIRRERWRRDG